MSDGRLNHPETLVKLSWVYDQLRQCKARQKVLVLDICRHNQVAGTLRPAGGSLSKDFDAQLRRVPDGVQVLVSCGVDQHGQEFEDGSVNFAGAEAGVTFGGAFFA